MKPTKNSPKNKFRASITYSQPLIEIGSVSTALGMTLEEVKDASAFFTKQALKNKVDSLVVIYENKKEYPAFDWVEVERFNVDENRGGKREGAGRKPAKYNSVLLQFKVPEHLSDELKKEIKTLIDIKKKLN